MAADEKDGLDIALVMGGPKKPPVPKPEYDEEMPQEYLDAYEDFKKNPSAETFWYAVESCVEAGKEASDKRAKKSIKSYD